MHLRVTGSETSALDLAKAMVTDDVKKVDAETKLKEKGYGSLPFHLKGDMAAFHILWAATVAAKTAARSVYFIYVNLAAQEFLLNWMPQDTLVAEMHMVKMITLPRLRSARFVTYIVACVVRSQRSVGFAQRNSGLQCGHYATCRWRSPLSN